METTTCPHTNPETFGEVQVIWTDRKNAEGILYAPCAECGEPYEWKVSQD